MPTFSNDYNGNAPLYYIPITLSANDGNGFQQMVNINSNTNSSYYASNLINVNWQDGAGNILDSWLESGETNTSTSTIYWVKLPNATITVIYQVIYDTAATSIDGSITGAEPNYTGTYGQYDNGANVFEAPYQNFSGTSTPSGWNTSGTITFSNSAYTTSGTAGILYTTANYGRDATYVLDWYGYSDSGNGNTFNSLGFWTGGVTADVSTGVRDTSGHYIYESWNGSSATDTDTGEATGTTNHVISINWSATVAQWSFDYATWTSQSSPFPPATAIPAGLRSGSGTGKLFAQWVRGRVYPSGGTMPTQTFGSITKITTYSSLLL